MCLQSLALLLLLAGVGGRVWVRRLRDADVVLTPEVVARMAALGRSWLGRHYDLQFRWDDDRLYCSELAWKRYDRGAGVQLGRLQRVRELDLRRPEVERLVRARYPDGAPPGDEPIVSPQALFDDPRLVEVRLP